MKNKMLTSAMTVVKSRQFKGLSGACVVYVWLAGVKFGGCTGFLEECFAAGVKSVKHFRRQPGGEAEALQTDGRLCLRFSVLPVTGVPEKGRWSLQAPVVLTL